MISELNRDLAVSLFEIGAIKFGAFKLKLHEKFPDAPLSPIYIDLRILRSFPGVMEKSIQQYLHLCSHLKFDIFADIPTSATPTTALLSYMTKKPMITPRMDHKDRGTRLPIDGSFTKGQIVLLIDDLVTHADSKLETIAVLEENGLIVNDVVVLIDREQGGIEGLKSKGYTCHSAFTLKELIRFYCTVNKITSDEYAKVIDYLETSNK